MELEPTASVRAAQAVDRRLHAVAPGPRDGCWAYVTTGCWAAANQHGHGFEFVLATREFTPRAVELLAMTAYFHAGPPGQRLGPGHTTTLGEPWLPGSACDHTLLSLPYPWWPDLDIVEWDGGHAQVLWLLPITRAERDFKRRHGLEALEERFGAAGIDYVDPGRASVV